MRSDRSKRGNEANIELMGQRAAVYDLEFVLGHVRWAAQARVEWGVIGW